jgi:hypothetical protein
MMTMVCNHHYLQLLCQFKIAMRRQALLVDLESFVRDYQYRHACLITAQDTGCPNLVNLADQLKMDAQL